MTSEEFDAYIKLYEKVNMLKEKGYYPNLTHEQLIRLLTRLDKISDRRDDAST